MLFGETTQAEMYNTKKNYEAFRRGKMRMPRTFASILAHFASFWLWKRALASSRVAPAATSTLL